MSESQRWQSATSATKQFDESRSRVRFLRGGLKDLTGTVVSRLKTRRVLVEIEAIGELFVEVDADSVAPLD